MNNFLGISALILLIAFIVVFIFGLISDLIDKYCEDSNKLTKDYDELVKRYCREDLLTYLTNGDSSDANKLPAIVLYQRGISDRPYEICIRNVQMRYSLPKQIANNSDWIMKAHAHSVFENNINIRLDDIKQTFNSVELVCSKTTYFDSLITNRAMDYQLKNGKTIREIYEPGPFLSRLSESKLSNHLGFNGFIETSDHKLIFVMRSNKVSIGKRTLTTSVSASLKAKYCLNDDRKLTVEGLRNAIRMEIEDELKIAIDKNTPFENTVFAFYRDLVEGGKPQFLFYYRLENITAREVENNFRKQLKEEGKKKNVNSCLVDGTKLYYFTLQELSNSTISSGEITIRDKKFKIMPSVATSIILLINSLPVTTD